LRRPDARTEDAIRLPPSMYERRNEIAPYNSTVPR
jgi:hypothetical protein